ncbi:zinc ribbon domain-containing protein [Clostridium botulinum]|uniref:zinc ribbon domain-containing protein n=1 Tax=Clostridium botulinum TaxID=1491 RepID=UPI001967DAF8|nr:zinc ribbon domain-containing protein [Clostridium botulinum]MBN1057079.1 zinc ribbon domain-containing protein [Clostridium botulinum]
MYCKYCGNEINYNAKFCDKCGNSTGEKKYRDKDGCQFNDDFIEEFYRESLMTSIIKGIDFIPSCLVAIISGIGAYNYIVGARVFGYAICIYYFPIWIIIAIGVTLYRIFMMPKLKKDNII